VHDAVDQDRLETEAADRVIQLGDRLLRRVRGDLGHRRQAVGVGEVDLRVEGVQRPARHLTQLGVADRERGEPAARVEHGEVDA
jgi:hypothetical protein